MTWSNAQIKDLLREILGVVKSISTRLDALEKEKAPEVAETPKPVVAEKTAPEVVDKKAEKRRIFLERMKQGRINAKAKRGLPIL